MHRRLLGSSLIALLGSAWLEQPLAMALSILAVLILLVWSELPSRTLAWAFGVWMAGIMGILLAFGEYRPGRLLWDLDLLGIPIAVLVLILGIWLVPILIWPVGFYRHFKRWSGE